MSTPLALLVLFGAAACQSAAPTSTPSSSQAASEPPASVAASESAIASASASAAGACLEPEVVAAIHEIGNGNFDTEPALAEVADALDALSLDGAAAETRDSLTTHLREDPPNDTAIVTAITGLKSQVALPEC